MKVNVKVTNECGVERTLKLDGKYEVCPRCEGEGMILNPNIGEHAYSAEEFDEAFPPYTEEREHYFKRGGMYDVTCPECHGKRVVEVFEREVLREHRSGKRILARIESAEQAEAECRAEEAAERRYFAAFER